MKAIIFFSVFLFVVAGCFNTQPGTPTNVGGISGHFNAVQKMGVGILMEVYPSGSFSPSPPAATYYDDRNVGTAILGGIGQNSTAPIKIWIEKKEDRDIFWVSATQQIGDVTMSGVENSVPTGIVKGDFFGDAGIISRSQNPVLYQVLGRVFVPDPNQQPTRLAPAQTTPKISKIKGETLFFKNGSSLTFDQKLLPKPVFGGKKPSTWGFVKASQ